MLLVGVINWLLASKLNSPTRNSDQKILNYLIKEDLTQYDETNDLEAVHKVQHGTREFDYL